MAIQNRRGEYKDFNPYKLQQGEWATVLSGDPNAKDGRSTYLSYGDGIVKRMATYEDMEENIDLKTADIVKVLTTETKEATQKANTATENAKEATIKADEATKTSIEATKEALDIIEQTKRTKEETEAVKSATVQAKEATEKATSEAQTATTQAQTAATNAQNIANTVEEKLEKGEFKGDKGDKGDPGSIDNLEEQSINFTKATTDEPIISGETLSQLFGKTVRLFDRVDANEEAIDTVNNDIEISKETQDFFKSIGWGGLT